MKPLFRLLTATLILTTVFTFMPVRPADAATCVVASGTNPPTAIYSFIALAGHSYLVTFRGPVSFDVPIGPLPVNTTFFVFPSVGQTATVYDLNGTCAGDGEFFNPGDDRLNREPGQPAALYCRNQGDVHVYAINDSIGKLAFIITKAEIDAVINRNPTANTLIKQSADGKFKLYYLPATKELSFITNENGTGKQYSHVWRGLCR